jgi:hypothetical protein
MKNITPTQVRVGPLMVKLPEMMYTPGLSVTRADVYLFTHLNEFPAAK